MAFLLSAMSDFAAKRTLRATPHHVIFQIMSEYQCWFCGEGIERTDTGAVMISVESFWLWADDKRAPDDPYQVIYAHAQCAKSRMAGSRMVLEPSIFGEEN